MSQENKPPKLDQQVPDWARDICHDMRTPINAIMGFSDILSRKVDPNDSALIQQIQEASHQLLALLDNVLLFSREEAVLSHLIGNTPIEPTYQKVAKQFNTKLNHRKIRIISELDPTLSPALYQQIFERFLSNLVLAVSNLPNKTYHLRSDATENAVTLSLEAENQTIWPPLLQSWEEPPSAVSAEALAGPVLLKLLKMMRGTYQMQAHQTLLTFVIPTQTVPTSD